MARGPCGPRPARQEPVHTMRAVLELTSALPATNAFAAASAPLFAAPCSGRKPLCAEAMGRHCTRLSACLLRLYMYMSTGWRVLAIKARAVAKIPRLRRRSPISAWAGPGEARLERHKQGWSVTNPLGLPCPLASLEIPGSQPAVALQHAAAIPSGVPSPPAPSPPCRRRPPPGPEGRVKASTC
jgi:hypothetical protein